MRWQSQECFYHHSWLKWQKQITAWEKDFSGHNLRVWPNSPISSTIFSVLPGGVVFSCSETKQNKQKRVTTSGGCPLDSSLFSERRLLSTGVFLVITTINTTNIMKTQPEPSCSQQQNLLPSATPPGKVLAIPSTASPSLMLLQNHSKS